jgi:hypothetical protein
VPQKTATPDHGLGPTRWHVCTDTGPLPHLSDPEECDESEHYPHSGVPGTCLPQGVIEVSGNPTRQHCQQRQTAELNGQHRDEQGAGSPQ